MMLLFLLSLTAVLAMFLLYPLALLLIPRRSVSQEPEQAQAAAPSISLVVVHREAGPLLKDKIADCLRLRYPTGRLQIVFFADGPCRYPELPPRNRTAGPRLLLTGSDDVLGKNEALNRAVALANNEILVLSDVDALLDPDVLPLLAAHFADRSVGGVCGRRRIHPHDQTGMHHGQKGYIDLDSLLKRLESRHGFLTANDGKLYAVRRCLFPQLPPGVTDDLFVCLAVTQAGSRFLFDERASAFIRSPSRSVAHEWQRRRRIVCCSLRGILLHRRLCNPLRYGLFAVGLVVNKVLRRLLFPFLLLLFFSSYQLRERHPFFLLCFLGQLLFYGLGLFYPLAGQSFGLPKLLQKGAQWSCYFLVGNLASTAGALDFLRGRTVTGWRPKKS